MYNTVTKGTELLSNQAALNNQSQPNWPQLMKIQPPLRKLPFKNHDAYHTGTWSNMLKSHGYNNIAIVDGEEGKIAAKLIPASKHHTEFLLELQNMSNELERLYLTLEDKLQSYQKRTMAISKKESGELKASLREIGEKYRLIQRKIPLLRKINYELLLKRKEVLGNAFDLTKEQVTEYQNRLYGTINLRLSYVSLTGLTAEEEEMIFKKTIEQLRKEHSDEEFRATMIAHFAPPNNKVEYIISDEDLHEMRKLEAIAYLSHNIEFLTSLRSELNFVPLTEEQKKTISDQSVQLRHNSINKMAFVQLLPKEIRYETDKTSHSYTGQEIEEAKARLRSCRISEASRHISDSQLGQVESMHNTLDEIDHYNDKIPNLYYLYNQLEKQINQNNAIAQNESLATLSNEPERPESPNSLKIREELRQAAAAKKKADSKARREAARQANAVQVRPNQASPSASAINYHEINPSVNLTKPKIKPILSKMKKQTAETNLTPDSELEYDRKYNEYYQKYERYEENLSAEIHKNSLLYPGIPILGEFQIPPSEEALERAAMKNAVERCEAEGLPFPERYTEDDKQKVLNLYRNCQFTVLADRGGQKLDNVLVDNISYYKEKLEYSAFFADPRYAEDKGERGWSIVGDITDSQKNTQVTVLKVKCGGRRLFLKHKALVLNPHNGKVTFIAAPYIEVARNQQDRVYDLLQKQRLNPQANNIFLNSSSQLDEDQRTIELKKATFQDGIQGRNADRSQLLDIYQEYHNERDIEAALTYRLNVQGKKR